MRGAHNGVCKNAHILTPNMDQLRAELEFSPLLNLL